VRGMVVGDHQSHIGPGQLGRYVNGRDPAVDGDDQPGPLLREASGSLDIQAETLLDPVRNVEGDLGAGKGQDVPQDSYPGRPIYVVIAIEDDFLAGANGIDNDPCRIGSARQLARRVKILELRCQEGRCGLVRREAAIDKKLGQQRRQLPTVDRVTQS